MKIYEELPIRYPTLKDGPDAPQSGPSVLINGYITLTQQHAKRPGLSSAFTTLGSISNQGIQGLFWSSTLNKFVASIAGNIYTIDEYGVVVDVTGDALVDNTMPVIIAESFSSVFLANGGQIVYFDSISKTQYLKNDAPMHATHVDIFDQFLITNNAVPSSIDQGRMFFSAQGDFLDWSAQSFLTAESSSDALTALHATFDKIYLFGPNSIEIFFNDGQTPFSRVPNGVIVDGVIAPYSVVDVSRTGLFDFIYVSKNREIRGIRGNQSTDLSVPISRYLRDMESLVGAKAFFLEKDGHSFYIVNFPTPNTTWVYCLQTQSWQQWLTYDSSNASFNRLQFGSAAYSPVFDMWLVGSSVTNELYRLDSSYFTDSGSVLKYVLTTGEVTHNTPFEKICHGLRLHLHRGDGVTDTTHTPTMLVQYQNNGSGPWINAADVSLGKAGSSELVADVPGPLGRYNTRRWKFTCTEAVEFRLYSATEFFEYVLPRTPAHTRAE